MNPDDRQILDVFAAGARARFPCAQVRAFGSRARGDATWESDLDVCVVLDQPVTRAVKNWIGDVAWEAGFDADRIVTTVVFERRAFEEGSQNLSSTLSIRHEQKSGDFDAF